MKNKPFKIFSVGEDALTAAIVENSIFGGGGQGKLKIDKFSDGEMSPQFMESIRDKTVFLVCSTSTPEKILQLELSIDAARRASAAEIVAVTPYFGYARQDKKEGTRGAVGAKVLANKITNAGAKRVITADLHADQIVGFFDIPVDHIYGRTVFRPYMELLPQADNYAIFSPDSGGTTRAQRMWERMLVTHPNTSFGMLYKHRDKPNSIDKMTLLGDVKGKKVILVDDMSDTAGTITKAAQICMDNGAEWVDSFITHPVLSGIGKERVDKCDALRHLIITDTMTTTDLPSKVIKVSCAKIFAVVIDKIVTHQSIDVVNA